MGILQVEHRNDQTQAARLRVWMDRIGPSFAGRILPVRYAQLHVPDRRPDRDALIAATALVHGLTVVTRNVADFSPMIAALNPWGLTPSAAR